MSSCTTTWQTFKVFQRKIALQFALWPKVSIITSSALILWTLRAGSSFFTVLLGLGKCITAVPAAMLEWLWQNLERIHDAMRSEIRSWMGKGILGKNNPAQGPVVRTPVSANPGLNFNPGFFFLLSKAHCRIIFSILFRVSNHQIEGKEN